ncbi:hypothetical protein FM113_10395 [Leucobacter sp. 7(1)]|nr:hypothetical protein FM113_10395 [Leucobacter sp. 7(1)]
MRWVRCGAVRCDASGWPALIAEIHDPAGDSRFRRRFSADWVIWA